MDATELAGELLLSVPANVTLGIRVDAAVDGHGAVSLDVPEHLTNVIGSLHASGLAGLVDACGLAAIISAMPDADSVRGLLPLGRAAQLQFYAPARGTLTARCELTQDARDELAGLSGPVRTDGPARTRRARFCTETTIVADDVAVAAGRFEWTVGRGD